MAFGPAEYLSLLDSLSGEWIKLPLTIMADAGPAVQTLGGLLNITTRETFSCVAEIATKARLPRNTVKKHLRRLHDAGWIENQGRDHTRRGALRRTATLKITKETKDHLEPYGFLPWWACCHIAKIGDLPWSAKAVLSVVMARLCALADAAGKQDGNLEDEDFLETLGGDERFKFSLKSLTKQTGLSRHSVIEAKRLLNHRFGIVEWVGQDIEAGTATEADHLLPNWEFRAVIMPASEDGVYVTFDRGAKVV